MAIKTLSSQYLLHDAAHGLSREIMSTKSDSDQIYYRVEPEQVTPIPEPLQAEILAKEKALPAVSLTPPTANVIPASSTTVPDQPVSAAEIILAIVATKLRNEKKTWPSLGATIQTLCGGRSTLQNEIIGNLMKEFGELPEGPENLSLEELSNLVQERFDGHLGAVSRSLIGRLISTKFATAIGITAIRSYLETRWMLQAGRQDGVLLRAVTIQPEERVGSEKESYSIIDNAVERYAADVQMDLHRKLPGDTMTNGKDHGAPEQTRRHHGDFPTMPLHHLVAFYPELREKFKRDATRTANLEYSVETLQAFADGCRAEYGTTFLDGVESHFKPNRMRKYESSWNWARQDLLQCIHQLKQNHINTSGSVGHRIQQIKNRKDSSICSLVQFAKGELSSCIGMEHIIEQLSDLARHCLDTTMTLSLPFPSSTKPKTVIDHCGRITYHEEPRIQSRADVKGRSAIYGPYSSPKSHDMAAFPSGLEETNMAFGVGLPGFSSKRRPAEVGFQPQHFISTNTNGKTFQYNAELSSQFFPSTLPRELVLPRNLHVLVIGAGGHSIGEEVVKGLLRCGASVLITTSSFSLKTTRHYQRMFRDFGSSGSRLYVVPFNQGSRCDVEALVEYIYDEKKGLGWNLDCILPFAAIAENDRGIDGIDSRSELAHRVMLTNVVRLLGAVKRQKQTKGILTRPTQIVLPLSPNHGMMGNDGLYAESKLSLMALFEKWSSEEWSDYLSICGVSIGWTRGTALMNQNDIIAEMIENAGVRTFSQPEMAYHILGFLQSSVREANQDGPLFANLDGGMSSLSKHIIAGFRKELHDASDMRRAIHEDKIKDQHSAIHRSIPNSKALLSPRSSVMPTSPKVLQYEPEIQLLSARLGGMVDLENTVVIVGYSELGPLGSARTRWEVEADGRLSTGGCVELAWMMGLIKYHNGVLKGELYSGWVDSKTKERLGESDIRKRHEAYIMKNIGLRLSSSTPSSASTQVLHEVVIGGDLAPFETDEETAQAFKLEQGENVTISQLPNSAEYSVQLHKGATLKIPKAFKSGRRVEGQLPTGWSPRLYGISEDVICQVDKTTLYLLACTADAFISAGITDPYEFYKFVHLSDVGNCIGTGAGPVSSTKELYNGRHMNTNIQNDLLQETFINTAAAWVNLLFLSSSGPIKTPVGACATSLESLDSGYELIANGTTKVCLVGGYDDLMDEVSVEFRNMQATIDAEEELANGRDPVEMSRPAASSRAGFVESQGCGVQILASAQLALEMGLPIYGIVAFTQLAGDKIGRSVPAPGKGVLTTVCESPSQYPIPKLDIVHRRRGLETRYEEIERQTALQLGALEQSRESRSQLCRDDMEREARHHRNEILEESKALKKQALNFYGNHFWKGDTRISPMRGALAVWGLTVDDISVVSFHGTSTKKNDINEANIIHEQMKKLGRKEGNVVPAVFQKHLTGHPKGAAGAWMLNGGLQMLDTGFIPGNRNADDVDQQYQKLDSLVVLDEGVQTAGVDAFLLSSFGFGQKGAQAIGIHSKYLFAVISEERYDAYCKGLKTRMGLAERRFQQGLIGNDLFKAKNEAPYKLQDEVKVLTDPTARIPAEAAGENMYIV